MKQKLWRVTDAGALEPAHAPMHHVAAPTKAAATAALLKFAARALDNPPAIRHRNGAYQLDWESLEERTAQAGRVDSQGCTLERATSHPSKDSPSFLYLSGPEHAACTTPSPDELTAETLDFEHHAARAFFASAWADARDEAGESCPGEIMDQMPPELDPAAVHAARTLRMDLERTNKSTVPDMLETIAEHACGDRDPTPEYFGHYAAMQAMGHGVGLGDAFGSHVRKTISVPFCEFGSYSLERDYFPETADNAD